MAAVATQGGILLVGRAPADTTLVRFLRRAGYDPVKAATAEAALDAARERRPVVVVSDVELPDLSGYELCFTLRLEFGDSIPIVFVSAERTAPVDRVAGLLIGADDYVPAPFDPGELLARLRRLVGRTSSPADADGAVELTSREREVLALLAEGRDQARIARELVISPKTVGSHIQHILVKLGAHSRAEAVALAYRRRLLDGGGA